MLFLDYVKTVGEDSNEDLDEDSNKEDSDEDSDESDRSGSAWMRTVLRGMIRRSA